MISRKNILNNIFISSKLFSLLLLALVLFFATCKQKENKELLVENTKIIEQPDSITFSIRFKGVGAAIINYDGKNYSTATLSFYNKKPIDTIITKTIPRLFENQTIYSGKRMRLGKSINQYFLIDKNSTKINFEFKNNRLNPLESNAGISASELYVDYLNMDRKIFSHKETAGELKKELDTLYTYYKKKQYGANAFLHKQLNDLEYMSKLERLFPKNKKVDEYLKQTKITIMGWSFDGLLFSYTNHHIDSFNYNELNSNNYSQKYIEYVSIGVFNFLTNKPNKGKKKYQPAINWLKTTALYRQDSVYIKKNIQPLNNQVFKSKLKNLVLLDSAFNETTFAKIVQQHPSNYYLIDFWATWCAPCISGIKKMQTLHIPNNVKIISLSVDKLSVQNKWKSTTKKLAQKITYLVNVKKLNSRNFLKFIELNTIPRYILIDKNMNLIDQAFLHPGEPSFLSKLQDVLNSKYW